MATGKSLDEMVLTIILGRVRMYVCVGVCVRRCDTCRYECIHECVCMSTGNVPGTVPLQPTIAL